MKTRTLVVDSSYLLKRSFHGAKNTYTTKFGHIGGLYSFFTTIRKLIKQHSINKVVLCWDGENGGIYRYRIDRNYKANRKSKKWHEKIVLSENEIRREKEKDESILKQRKRIQAYAEELFLRQIEVDEVEADDLIAAYCIKYNNKEELYIYSNDRDFAQLLDLNITIIFPNLDVPITKRNFYTEFGYHYSNALIFKIICGDNSDNVKGIQGVKEPTLLKYFPEVRAKETTVREICKKADELNKKRISEGKKPLKALENIVDGVDRYKINYQLVNLRSPLLNEQAEDDLLQLEMPLSPEGRSSKILYKMMVEDDFLSVFGSNFVNYVQPFYSVIMSEKDKYNEYNTKK
jgi:DNA polymerase I